MNIIPSKYLNQLLIIHIILIFVKRNLPKYTIVITNLLLIIVHIY